MIKYLNKYRELEREVEYSGVTGQRRWKSTFEFNRNLQLVLALSINSESTRFKSNLLISTPFPPPHLYIYPS